MSLFCLLCKLNIYCLCFAWKYFRQHVDQYRKRETRLQENRIYISWRRPISRKCTIVHLFIQWKGRFIQKCEIQKTSLERDSKKAGQRWYVLSWLNILCLAFDILKVILFFVSFFVSLVDACMKKWKSLRAIYNMLKDKPSKTGSAAKSKRMEERLRNMKFLDECCARNKYEFFVIYSLFSSIKIKFYAFAFSGMYLQTTHTILIRVPLRPKKLMKRLIQILIWPRN